jgi:hypothetical protein
MRSFSEQVTLMLKKSNNEKKGKELWTFPCEKFHKKANYLIMY